MTCRVRIRSSPRHHCAASSSYGLVALLQERFADALVLWGDDAMLDLGGAWRHSDRMTEIDDFILMK
jgi:hypothetical protein